MMPISVGSHETYLSILRIKYVPPGLRRLSSSVPPTPYSPILRDGPPELHVRQAREISPIKRRCGNGAAIEPSPAAPDGVRHMPQTEDSMRRC